MITEDYCSYEVAKLLKEKGFDESTSMVYMSCGNLCKLNRYDSICNSNYNDITKNYFEYTAPTHQMAMKWLREVHNLHIWVGHSVNKGLPWYYEIHGISDGKVKHIGGIQCGSYEGAVEAALKYCLENLI